MPQVDKTDLLVQVLSAIGDVSSKHFKELGGKYEEVEVLMGKLERTIENVTGIEDGDLMNPYLKSLLLTTYTAMILSLLVGEDIRNEQ